MALEDVELELVNSFEKAEEFMRWLGQKREVLAFDTETSGLDPEMEKLRLIQFGDMQMGWAIPYEGWGGLALEAIQKYEGDLVAHNAKFDVRFIEHHGKIRLPRERIHDTRMMCHLLNPAGSTALKPNAARLVDPKAAYASGALDDAMKAQKWTSNCIGAMAHWIQFSRLISIQSLIHKSKHRIKTFIILSKQFNLFLQIWSHVAHELILNTLEINLSN